MRILFFRRRDCKTRDNLQPNNVRGVPHTKGTNVERTSRIHKRYNKNPAIEDRTDEMTLGSHGSSSTMVMESSLFHHATIPKCSIESTHERWTTTRSTNNSINKSTNEKHFVNFSTVEIRSYERIVGDHPDVEIPLAIGWKYHMDSKIVTVESFEENKRKLKQVVVDLETKDSVPFTTCDSTILDFHNTCKITKKSFQDDRIEGVPKFAITTIGAVRNATTTTNNKIRTVTKQNNCYNKNIEIASCKHLEPVPFQGRVHLLKSIGGYTLSELYQAERRRRLQMVLEWSYRYNPQDLSDPCPVKNFSELFIRYVL